MITPPKPINNPTIFPGLKPSSFKDIVAIRKVNNGTVALRMEATAESMLSSPQVINPKGMATFVKPRIIKAIHTDRLCGSLVRLTRMAMIPTRAPKKVRNATNVMGLNSRMAILIQRKDELHMAARRIKANQCLIFIQCPYSITKCQVYHLHQ